MFGFDENFDSAMLARLGEHELKNCQRPQGRLDRD
jgi:hypothetical protein